MGIKIINEILDKLCIENNIDIKFTENGIDITNLLKRNY